MTQRRNPGHEDAGTTLVELVIATAILLVVIATVGIGVTLISSSTSAMAEEDQAIDQLQVAEQAVVRDVHAATKWCNAPSASQLEFEANLDATSVAIDVALSAGGELTIAQTSSCTAAWPAPDELAANVDPSVSGFSLPGGPRAVTWTAGSSTYSYITSISVNFTMDSPRTGAPHEIRTTVADPVVEIWNAELACQSNWAASPGGGSDPC